MTVWISGLIGVGLVVLSFRLWHALRSLNATIDDESFQRRRFAAGLGPQVPEKLNWKAVAILYGTSLAYLALLSVNKNLWPIGILFIIVLGIFIAFIHVAMAFLLKFASDDKESVVAPQSDLCFYRIDFHDGLAIGGNIHKAPRPSVIFTFLPTNALSHGYDEQPLLTALYGEGWEYGNDDGSQYVPGSWETTFVGLLSMDVKNEWREQSDDLNIFFMVPESGEHRVVDMDEFEKVASGLL